MSRMRRSRISYLLVVDAGRLVGVLSHRDWTRILMGAVADDWERQPVTRIMTEDPVTVAPGDAGGRRCACPAGAQDRLPSCTRRETICGILTVSDALEALLSAMG